MSKCSTASLGLEQQSEQLSGYSLLGWLQPQEVSRDSRKDDIWQVVWEALQRAVVPESFEFVVSNSCRKLQHLKVFLTCRKSWHTYKNSQEYPEHRNYMDCI